jgi:hypothetical protein
MEALDSMRGMRLRPEVKLTEIPGPSAIAPFTVAFNAVVIAHGSELATGRFVLLHDPDGQSAWHGDFRIITLTCSPIDPEVAGDPMCEEVAWTWVTDAADDVGVDTLALGGTVTRITSTPFGTLAHAGHGSNGNGSGEESEPHEADIEIRASWTPADTNIGAHVHLWAGILTTACGLQPLPEGVIALTPRRLASR